MKHLHLFRKMAGMVLTAMVLSAPSSGRCAGYQAPAGPTVEPQPEVLTLQNAFTRVADTVKPAVVSISTTHVERASTESLQFYYGDPMEQFYNQFFGGGESPNPESAPRRRAQKMEGMGSGVIIDPDGLVLTNDHVVRGADEIKVLVYDQDGTHKEYPAHVVGKDARTDIAVVRIRAGHKLPFAALGNSDGVKVGDWAVAIGSPFGLSQTFTVGVISAARQSLTIEDKEYRNLIQTDAAINRGNSGGPLLNIRGEVVGINTAIYAPTGVFAGIGFAVPINQAKAILTELVDKGHVTRGWLGVELQNELTPAIVNAFGLKDTKGALVNSVLPHSPAEQAGLKRGDVIISYDGKAVASSDELQSLVSETAPRKTVALKIVRAKKNLALKLTIGERPTSADLTTDDQENPSADHDTKANEREWSGVHLTSLDPDIAEHFQVPAGTAGVMVSDVDSGSAGEDIGLQPGDLICSVNQQPTPDLTVFMTVIGKVRLSEGIVLDVVRQGHALYLSFTKP